MFINTRAINRDLPWSPIMKGSYYMEIDEKYNKCIDTCLGFDQHRINLTLGGYINCTSPFQFKLMNQPT